MAKYLHPENRHLLLEPEPNEKNSFIANVNTLVKNFDTIKEFNETYDSDSVTKVADLLATEDTDGNTVAESFKIIAEDLKKGTYRGYRKLDINLLKNYNGYSDSLSDSAKSVIWNNESNRVYYSGCDIYLEANNIVKHYDFDKILFTGVDLYNALMKILKTYHSDNDGNLLNYYPVESVVTTTITNTDGSIKSTVVSDPTYIYDGSISGGLNTTTKQTNSDSTITTTNTVTTTLYDYIIRTDIIPTAENNTSTEEVSENIYIVRVYDNFVSDNGLQQSNITKIVLNEATAAQYATVQGIQPTSPSNRSNPEYTWTDTTSSLYTIANQVSAIKSCADQIESLGSTFTSDIKTYASNAKASAEYAETEANLAVEKANQIATLTVSSEAIDALEDPYVVYTKNSTLNDIKFELPRNMIVGLDLTHWALNTANGHLTLETISENDIDSVTADTDTGTVTIKLKS